MILWGSIKKSLHMLISYPSVSCVRVFGNNALKCSAKNKRQNMVNTRDNEVIVANGTIITADMSEVRADLCHCAMSRQYIRKLETK